MGAQRFEAELERRGSGTVVCVPFDPVAEFGRVRAPVRARVNGFEFRTTLMRYGGVDYMGLNREVRDGAGVDVGARLEVEVELDEEPRVVDMPPDLAAALQGESAARDAFEGLSYTHRKEYVQWIEEAKREETRRSRVEKTISMLTSGVKTPG
ncbi:MAG TPA: YdeI/OmpD-associated family protein [Gaiellaceae bacterium]|nr:YdeI/OmpD-associated family protein [Gaiellaceae bacterium]